MPAPRSWYRRKLVWLIGGLCILAGYTVSAVFLGYFVGARELVPHLFFARVENKLERTFLPKGPPDPLSPQTFNTHLLFVDADIGTTAIGDPMNNDPISQNGGGITSFGSEVLLLPYDGRIYAASSGSDLRFTGIVAPDNNRAAYQAVADDPKYSQYEIRKGYLRYNDLASYETETEQGLLASYTEYHPKKMCATNTVAKLVFDESITSIDQVTNAGDDWLVLYRSEPCLEFKTKYFALEGHLAGGRLAIMDSSTILLANGDFHIDGMRSEAGPGIAQDEEADYGKVIAIDLLTGENHIFSSGHRNPQGLDVMSDGTILLSEHGPRGGDELNIIREGANYGWPLESYGVTYYGGTQIPGSRSFGRHDEFEPPIYSWVPSVATSSLTLIEGFNPAWDGDVLVAALLDQSIFRLRLQGDRVIYSERIEIGSRIRDVHQHSDGRLVLWTDNQELIFLTGRERQNMQELFERFVKKSKLSSKMADRLKTAIAVCAECHSFDVGDHQKAPGLAQIYGDRIGKTPFDGYSEALSGHDGKWTEENLAAFIRSPKRFVPGTWMENAELGDDDLIDMLVDFLKAIDEAF